MPVVWNQTNHGEEHIELPRKLLLSSAITIWDSKEKVEYDILSIQKNMEMAKAVVTKVLGMSWDLISGDESA